MNRLHTELVDKIEETKQHRQDLLESLRKIIEQDIVQADNQGDDRAFISD